MYFQAFSESISLLDKEYVPSREASAIDLFRRFGLSDTVLSLLAQQQLLMITTDFRLYGTLASQGLDVLNFNQLRSWVGV